MRRKIELPVEEIVAKWENGVTQMELAVEYEICYVTIRKRINEWYEEKGKMKPERGRKKNIELQIEEIVLKWENGLSLQKLAYEYGTNHVTIGKRINEWYEEKGKIKPKRDIKRKKKKELPVEEIVRKWQNGITQQELADKYGVNSRTISRRIHEWYEENGKIKPERDIKRGSKKKIELPVEEIVGKWKNGTTQKELADEYGTSCGTIFKKINEWYEEKEKEKTQDAVKRSNSKVIKERVIRGSKIIIEYLKKGATPEQIIEIAEKNRVVIPDSVMQEAIRKVQETSEKRIQKDIGRDIDE